MHLKELFPPPPASISLEEEAKLIFSSAFQEN
jgi:hypothetical protein